MSLDQPACVAGNSPSVVRRSTSDVTDSPTSADHAPDGDAIRQVLDCLAGAERILIFSHVSPDGDALGSALGLMLLLRAQGKVADVSFADPPSPNFHFLPGVESIAHRSADGYDLVVAVDGSDGERYGSHFSRALAEGRPTLCIDHHKTNTYFATVQWVDSRYAATAQMIYELSRQAGWPLSPEIATCLATGCITDSNAFSTDHTTPALLEDVAALMREGAPLATIMYYVTQQRTPSDALLWGRVLASLQIEPGLAWVVSRLADREAIGANKDEGSGITTFIRGIDGVEVGIMFVEETPTTIRLSMRSSRAYDVGTLAFQLGGGGHAQAAGVTLSCTLDEALQRVLPLARALVATHP